MSSVSVDANDNGSGAVHSTACSQQHDNNNQPTVPTVRKLSAAEAGMQSDSDRCASPVGSSPVVLDARRRRCSAPGVGLYHKIPVSEGCGPRKLSSPLVGASIHFTPTPPPSPSHRGLVVNEPYVFAWTQLAAAAAASSVKEQILEVPEDSQTKGPSRRLSDPGCGRRWNLDSHWPPVILRSTDQRTVGTPPPPPHATVHCPLPGISSPPTAPGEGTDRNPRLMVTPSSPICRSGDQPIGVSVVTSAPTRRHSVALGHLSAAHYLEAIAEETGIARTAGCQNDAGVAAAAAAVDTTDGAVAQSARRHSLTGQISLTRPEDWWWI